MVRPRTSHRQRLGYCLSPARIKPVSSRVTDIQSLLSLRPVNDYNLVMNIVNVAILKEKLSYYLALVKSGEEVIVTSHRHRVARILPVTEAAARIVEPIRPVKDLRKLKGIKPRHPLSGVKSLLDERRRR